MNIAHAAKASGLPPKTIRYYEDIGLVHAGRRPNGYRFYREADVHRLRFLQRARSLGFTIEECRTLMSLYDDKARASADVKRIAQEHLAHIEQKIAELEGLRRTLGRLVDDCHGDERPECPILDDLSAA